MDSPGLMVRAGLYPKRETDTERERCCLNLGHHNNIAPGCKWKCWEGQVHLNVLAIWGNDSWSTRCWNTPFPAVLMSDWGGERGRKVKWEPTPPLSKRWQCTLQTSTPSSVFLLAPNVSPFPLSSLRLPEPLAGQHYRTIDYLDYWFIELTSYCTFTQEVKQNFAYLQELIAVGWPLPISPIRNGSLTNIYP